MILGIRVKCMIPLCLPALAIKFGLYLHTLGEVTNPSGVYNPTNSFTSKTVDKQQSVPKIMSASANTGGSRAVRDTLTGRAGMSIQVAASSTIGGRTCARSTSVGTVPTGLKFDAGFQPQGSRASHSTHLPAFGSQGCKTSPRTTTPRSKPPSITTRQPVKFMALLPN